MMAKIFKYHQKPFVILIACLFFIVPNFVVAQTFPLNIGLGTSLGFEFAIPVSISMKFIIYYNAH
jgi:hypothetical protein